MGTLTTPGTRQDPSLLALLWRHYLQDPYTDGIWLFTCADVNHVCWCERLVAERQSPYDKNLTNDSDQGELLTEVSNSVYY